MHSRYLASSGDLRTEERNRPGSETVSFSMRERAEDFRGVQVAQRRVQRARARVNLLRALLDDAANPIARARLAAWLIETNGALYKRQLELEILLSNAGKGNRL